MGSFGKEKVYFFSRHTDRELRIHQLLAVQINPFGPVTGDVHLPAAAQDNPRNLSGTPLGVLADQRQNGQPGDSRHHYKVQQAIVGHGVGAGVKAPAIVAAVAGANKGKRLPRQALPSMVTR